LKIDAEEALRKIVKYLILDALHGTSFEELSRLRDEIGS
jgi:hypothetical protein